MQEKEDSGVEGKPKMRFWLEKPAEEQKELTTSTQSAASSSSSSSASAPSAPSSARQYALLSENDMLQPLDAYPIAPLSRVLVDKLLPSGHYSRSSEPASFRNFSIGDKLDAKDTIQKSVAHTPYTDVQPLRLDLLCSLCSRLVLISLSLSLPLSLLPSCVVQVVRVECTRCEGWESVYSLQ